MYFLAIMMWGKIWPSPYTKKSIDYVLSSTKDNLDAWVTVKGQCKRGFYGASWNRGFRYIRCSDNDRYR